MTTDINKLLERLRTYYGDDLACRTLLMDARHALEALAGEVESLKQHVQAEIDERARMDFHHMHALADLAAERDRLQLANARMKATLGEYAHTNCEGWCRDAPANAFFEDCGGCPARKALGGDE